MFIDLSLQKWPKIWRISPKIRLLSLIEISMEILTKGSHIREQLLMMALHQNTVQDVRKTVKMKPGNAIG